MKKVIKFIVYIKDSDREFIEFCIKDFSDLWLKNSSKVSTTTNIQADH